MVGTESEVVGTEVEVAVPVRDGVISNVVCGVDGSDNEMTALHVGKRGRGHSHGRHC